MSDVLAIEEAIRGGKGTLISHRAFDDAVSYRVTWKGRTLVVVYSPVHGCARTVLPV